MDVKNGKKRSSTDGSKDTRAQYTGAATIWPEINSNKSYTTLKILTIYLVETIAVLEALLEVEESMKDRYLERKLQVFMCSDSESLVKAVTNCDISVHINPYIVKIRHKIYQLSKKEVEVILIWTLAHRERESR